MGNTALYLCIRQTHYNLNLEVRLSRQVTCVTVEQKYAHQVTCHRWMQGHPTALNTNIRATNNTIAVWMEVAPRYLIQELSKNSCDTQKPAWWKRAWHLTQETCGLLNKGVIHFSHCMRWVLLVTLFSQSGCPVWSKCQDNEGYAHDTHRDYNWTLQQVDPVLRLALLALLQWLRCHTGTHAIQRKQTNNILHA